MPIIMTPKFTTSDGESHDSANAAIDRERRLSIAAYLHKRRFELKIDESAVVTIARVISETRGDLIEIFEHDFGAGIVKPDGRPARAATPPGRFSGVEGRRTA